MFQVKSVDDLSGRSNALHRGDATSSVSCVAPNDVYPSQPTPLHPLEYGERRIFNLMENTELLTYFMSYREANLRHVTNIIKTDVIDYFVTYRGEKISKLGNHLRLALKSPSSETSIANFVNLKLRILRTLLLC